MAWAVAVIIALTLAWLVAMVFGFGVWGGIRVGVRALDVEDFSAIDKVGGLGFKKIAVLSIAGTMIAVGVAASGLNGLATGELAEGGGGISEEAEQAATNKAKEANRER